jgi:ribosomal protein S27AE
MRFRATVALTRLWRYPLRMTDRARYDREQEAALRARLARGETAICPRCGERMVRRAIPQPEAVSYVRHRDWYVCGTCGGGLVVDRPPGTAGPSPESSSKSENGP